MQGIEKYLSRTQNGHLALHGVDLASLTDEYGTPLFVFDELSLENNFELFHKAFERVYPKTLVCYSIKTNSLPAISKILRKKGAFAEIASELDLYVAKMAGFSGENLIFDGPYKSDKTLQMAIEEGIFLINVESFTELKRVNKIAEKMGVKQAIGIRINPFTVPNFLKSLTPKNLFRAAHCYSECRFGFSIEEARLAFKQIAKMKNLCLECLMVHPYHAAVKVLPSLSKEVYKNFNIEIKYLNIGGGFDPGVNTYASPLSLMWHFIKQKLGFGIALEGKKVTIDINAVAKFIADSIKQSMENLPEPTIISEPGRFLVTSSALLLVHVDHVKTAGEYKWVFVDGGTNIVPSIYERHKIVIVNRAPGSTKEVVNIVGPLLYADDFIGIKVLIPKISEDDILAVLNCGAYTISSSTQFLYPRPNVLLVDFLKNVKVIRERETVEDVLRKDKVPI